jgi:hypothetical protein
MHPAAIAAAKNVRLPKVRLLSLGVELARYLTNAFVSQASEGPKGFGAQLDAATPY